MFGMCEGKKVQDSNKQVQRFHNYFLQAIENWDGDGDMAGYSGGENYAEGGPEEQGESEVQGVSIDDLFMLA